MLDSLMLMVLAEALSASTFNLAIEAFVPLADTDAHVLTSFKIALESRITVINGLSRVDYLDNLRCLWHHAWHCHLLRRLLPLDLIALVCLRRDQSRDWLNTVGRYLWGY